MFRFTLVFVFSISVLAAITAQSVETVDSSDETTATPTTAPVVTSDIPDFSIPCKVPTFVKILPVSYRRQLKKIWSGVPLNSDCGHQLGATRELINNLPASLKLKIAEYGELEDKFRANFFAELLPEEKAEFGLMLKNLSMNAIEKAEALREWGQDRLSLAAFENFEEYLNVFLERDRKFQDKLKKLSPEARKAYDKVQEIRREKQQLMSRLSEKAKKELAALFRSECAIHRPHQASSRVQWDPVGVRIQEKQAQENHDYNCLSSFELHPSFGAEFTPLTRAYNREPTTTPISSTTEAIPPPDTPSAGRRLFNLFIQRVHYLKPLIQQQ